MTDPNLPNLSIDVSLGVTIPARHARGRGARIGPALDRILANHDYPPVLETLLAEALVLAVVDVDEATRTNDPDTYSCDLA